MGDDAKTQIKTALDRIEEIFGVRPKGMWPPELCIGPKTLEVFANEDLLITAVINLLNNAIK